MPSIANFAFHHFGLVGLLVAAANGAYLAIKNPAVLNRYRNRTNILPVAASLVPMLVMIVGDIAGGVPNIFHFMQPYSGNPYALAFLGAVLFNIAVDVGWYVLLGGRAILINEKQGAVFRKRPWLLDIILGLSMAAAIVAFVSLWRVTLPDWILAL